jgi:hypothetical protein
MPSLPAFSFSAPPEDAPRRDVDIGRFTAGPGAGQHAASRWRQNGLMRPFFGQPLQGFSGYAVHPRSGDGAIYALIDNGFGSKANSSDALLSFTRVVPDFDDRRNRGAGARLAKAIPIACRAVPHRP